MLEASPSLRILMTADGVGGVWNYCMELAHSESFRQVHICLAVLGGALSPAQSAEASRLSHLRVEEGPFKLEWMDQPWEDVARSGEWLLQLEQRFAPDVIHLNGYCHGSLPFRAPKLVVGHSCVLSWWQAVKSASAPEAWDRYRQEVAAGLRGASLVVAPSRAMLESLRLYYGALGNTRVIYNGRRSDQYAPNTKEPFILSAGRVWDEAKNIATLAEIAPDLPWTIYVAGAPSHPSDPLRTFHARRVEFLGQLASSALAGWYGRASIYALPALYEPFGLSILEAALSGCALVLGDIPSLREIWGEAALFIPPSETREWRRVIGRLCEDSAGRAALAGRARHRALSFTAERMADAYWEAYASMPAVSKQSIEELAACG